MNERSERERTRESQRSKKNCGDGGRRLGEETDKEKLQDRSKWALLGQIILLLF